MSDIERWNTVPKVPFYPEATPGRVREPRGLTAEEAKKMARAALALTSLEEISGEGRKP